MTPDVRDVMFAHALTEAPHEACGMFSARDGVDLVDVFHAMRNTAESEVLFALDGQEMLDLERQVEVSARSLLGVMHSHTTTSAYPSPTDVRDSGRFDPSGALLHVIVSLRHAEPVMRCYRIEHEVIVEVPLVITDGDDTIQDDDSSIAVAMAAVRPLPVRD